MRLSLATLCVVLFLEICSLHTSYCAGMLAVCNPYVCYFKWVGVHNLLSSHPILKYNFPFLNEFSSTFLWALHSPPSAIPLFFSLPFSFSFFHLYFANVCFNHLTLEEKSFFFQKIIVYFTILFTLLIKHLSCYAGKIEDCKELFRTLYTFIYMLGTYLKPHVSPVLWIYSFTRLITSDVVEKDIFIVYRQIVLCACISVTNK